MRNFFPTETLDRWLQHRLLDVHTCVPCAVISYDASKQTVDVQPQTKRYLIADDDTRTAESLPVLYDVPVAFPRANGFHISMPIAAGDTVLVVFAEEPTHAYRAKGREVEPGMLDRHGLNGAYALPCGAPDKNKLATAPPTNAIEIASDSGGGSVTVKEAEVLLGDNTATDLVALSSKVDAFVTFIDTVMSGWTPSPPDGGAALLAFYTATKTALYPLGIGSVAAAKTKAK